MNATVNKRAAAQRRTASMVRPVRGEVWFVRGRVDNTRGTELWPNRDAVIVSPTARNLSGGFVVIAFLRSDVPASPMHVVTSHGTVMTEQLHTVDKSQLMNRKGRLDDHDLRRVEDAIASTIGLDLED